MGTEGVLLDTAAPPPGHQPALTIKCTTAAALGQIFHPLFEEIWLGHYRTSVEMMDVGSAPGVVKGHWTSGRQVGGAKLNREKVAHINRAMMNCFTLETGGTHSLIFLPANPKCPATAGRPPASIHPQCLSSERGALETKRAGLRVETKR